MVKSYVSTEGDAMLKDNYDLNIWDKAGYFSEGKEEGWAIAVYSINNDGDAYGSGDMVAELRLTDEESQELTLGKTTDEGGDYSPDEDFWLDRITFLDVYKSVPQRVREFLEGVGNV